MTAGSALYSRHAREGVAPPWREDLWASWQASSRQCVAVRVRSFCGMRSLERPVELGDA